MVGQTGEQFRTLLVGGEILSLSSDCSGGAVTGLTAGRPRICLEGCLTVDLPHEII